MWKGYPPPLKDTSPETCSHRSPEFRHAFKQDYLNDPRNCPYSGRKLSELAGTQEEPLDVPDFFKHAAVWLVISSFGSLFLGMAFLLIFKHAPKTMVRCKCHLPDKLCYNSTLHRGACFLGAA